MKKQMKRILAYVLLVAMLLGCTATGAYAEEYEPDDAVDLMAAGYVTRSQLNQASVFISQGHDGDGTCVWSAVTSMVRRAAMLTGNTNWKSLTKSYVGAYCGYASVKHNFTVAGLNVQYRAFSGNKTTLINLLAEHPEGIVIYIPSIPHGLLLTDYTGGQFYCCDPILAYYNKGPRIPLMESSFKRDCGTLTNIINSIKGYWYVNLPTTYVPIPEMTTTAVSTVKAEPAGNQLVKITWKAKKGAEGYVIYADKDGKYVKVASVSSAKLSYTDFLALDRKTNTYYVFAYAYKTSGKKFYTVKGTGATAKGICPAVGNLKATGVTGGVKLTWTRANESEGYLIYKKDAAGTFKLVGQTGSTKFSFTDAKASSSKANYYRVYSFHRDGNGKKILGRTPETVYAIAK